MEDNSYSIYAEKREPGITDDGACLEWWRGCNRTQHVDLLQKIYYDKDGKVEDAAILAYVVRGPCPHDRKCDLLDEDFLGSF